MRIAYVCADPGIALFGTKGASVHVQEVIRALRRAGHQVNALCLRRGDAVPADLADLPVEVFPLPPGAQTPANARRRCGEPAAGWRRQLPFSVRNG
ncbi:Uncharacterised protein [Serratia rubidaea]|nr:Uncharacterised protein [Serratia rubidaea]